MSARGWLLNVGDVVMSDNVPSASWKPSEELAAFLVDYRLLERGTTPTFRSLSGGVSSEIWLVETARQRICVKLDGIDLSIRAGERFGIIGPNGSGETTLVNCISATLNNEEGTILFDGRRVDALPPHRRTKIGVSRSFQLPRPFHSMTVAENLKLALLYTAHEKQDRGSCPPLALADEIKGLLGRVGLSNKMNRFPRQLTQIEMRKLELARAMASSPELIIVDEAMAVAFGSRSDNRSAPALTSRASPSS